jgi:hypothetical protein
MLLVVDHQLGLFQLVRDFGPDEYRNNILAHAAVGKVFNLPTILTTSAEQGNYVYLDNVLALIFLRSQRASSAGDHRDAS